MTKLAYFAYNYPHNWIEEVWGEGLQATEFRQRFGAIYDKKGPTLGFWDFYMELSENNREKVNEYVVNEYRGMRSQDQVIFGNTYSIGDKVLGGEVSDIDFSEGIVYTIDLPESTMVLTQEDLTTAINTK